MNSPPFVADTLLVTRIHAGNLVSLPPISRVIDFVDAAAGTFSRILICFGIGENMEHSKYYHELKTSLGKIVSCSAEVLAITPWGHFTFALNAALSHAAQHGCSYIAYQSLEVRIDHSDVLRLRMHLHPDTLVVGAAFPGHEFKVGEHMITGRKCPWNTFAIWDVRKLICSGFPLIGDGFGDAVPSGVEEVSAISLLQVLHPAYQAKLVSLASICWNTEFTDAKREEKHRQKMVSKDTRPHAQLEMAGIPPGRVVHVDDVGST